MKIWNPKMKEKLAEAISAVMPVIVIVLLLCISIVITAAALRYLGLTEKLWHYLLPGDGEVTSRALQVMLEHLKQGGGIVEAVTAFCRRILEGAQLV